MFEPIRSNEFTKTILSQNIKQDINILKFGHKLFYNDFYFYWCQIELIDGTLLYPHFKINKNDQQSIEDIACSFSIIISKFLDIINGRDDSSKLDRIVLDCLSVKYHCMLDYSSSFLHVDSHLQFVKKFIMYSKLRLGTNASLIDVYNDCLDNFPSKYSIV